MLRCNIYLVNVPNPFSTKAKIMFSLFQLLAIAARATTTAQNDRPAGSER